MHGKFAQYAAAQELLLRVLQQVVVQINALFVTVEKSYQP